jgi:hypothetical protein
MFAAFKNYGIHTGEGDEVYKYNPHFTKQDCSNLLEPPVSLKGKASRRKLILAVTEDSVSFRELQEQLRQRRLVTHGAVCLTVMGADDPALLQKMGRMVRRRGVDLPREKQIEFDVYGNKSAFRNKNTNIGGLNLSGNANAILKGLQGLVNKKKITATPTACASENENERKTRMGLGGWRASSTRSLASAPTTVRISSAAGSCGFTASSNKPASDYESFQPHSSWSVAETTSSKKISLTHDPAHAADASFHAGDWIPASPGMVLQEAMSIVTGTKKRKNKGPQMHVASVAARTSGGEHTNSKYSLYHPAPERPGFQSWNISSKSLSKDVRDNLRVLERPNSSQMDIHMRLGTCPIAEEVEAIHQVLASPIQNDSACDADDETDGREGYRLKDSMHEEEEDNDEQEGDMLLVDFVPRINRERLTTEVNADLESGMEKPGILPVRPRTTDSYNWAAHFAPPMRTIPESHQQQQQSRSNCAFKYANAA